MRDYKQMKKESENTWMIVSTGTETALSLSLVKTYMNIHTSTPHIQDHQKKKTTHQPYQKHQQTIISIIYQISIKINTTLIQAQDQSISNTYHDHWKFTPTPIQMDYKILIDDHYIGQ
jgi:hypothetical protein